MSKFKPHKIKLETPAGFKVEVICRLYSNKK